jgi:hypothetical protein
MTPPSATRSLDAERVKVPELQEVASVKVVYDAERVVLALRLGLGLGSFTSFDSMETVVAVDGLVASTARRP